MDTLKVFKDNKIVKIYHGPMSDDNDNNHSPYNVNNWIQGQQNDSVYVKFTFTDEDFE